MKRFTLIVALIVSSFILFPITSKGDTNLFLNLGIGAGIPAPVFVDPLPVIYSAPTFASASLVSRIGSNTFLSFNIGVPAPVFVAPTPVVVAPPIFTYPSVIIEPAPVFVHPAPVIIHSAPKHIHIHGHPHGGPPGLLKKYHGHPHGGPPGHFKHHEKHHYKHKNHHGHKGFKVKYKHK